MALQRAGRSTTIGAGTLPFPRTSANACSCPCSRRRWCWKAAASTSTAQGLLLTTEECLLSPVQARNPELSREEIERRLRDYLGAERVVWLKNGIAGDDTHGHVDDLARFVNPETVVLVRGERSGGHGYAA